MRLCANLSMLFAELPLEDRFAAAAMAGFEAVEIQFPHEHDLDALVRARDKAGLPVVLINVPRGVGDEVGLACVPGREADFEEAVATCLRHARALDVAKVNVLAGRPPPGADAADCRATLIGNLRLAADRFAAIGVRVMVEPVNRIDVPGFLLGSLAAGLEALAQAEHPNLHLQFDLYHMTLTEPDLLAAIATAGKRIGHVQFADAPGRHEPGTGKIDFGAAFAALRRAGYHGDVAAEYRPSGTTVAGLGWMPTVRAALAG
jgi:hydroxypyruvate isomerase